MKNSDMSVKIMLKWENCLVDWKNCCTFASSKMTRDIKNISYKQVKSKAKWIFRTTM